ncbi:hypothetical protein BN85403430 [Alteracholeplasma palmae J233]|uniref:Uncharacterized protein n=1 Tax=Alteracholeplasma palmae (strain ATCC 49389 / J233) TaxID=1318466 RepID=U4KP03_ALTPJ|nr:hypothetical protein [Alteracholeplasma palmae]CCV63920.1 hypothetical protein BN85403430 [Alteracholeplasma palmae J233]
MNFEQLFETLDQQNSILVISDVLKRRVIQMKSEYEIKSKKLFKFSILTESEVIDLLTFKTDKELVLYALSQNKMPISITNEKIKFAKYNLNHVNNDLNLFFESNKKYIYINELFLEKAKSSKFYLLSQELHLKPIFNHFNISYEVVGILKEKTPIIHKFSSKKEEVFYLFESISNLLKNGTDINHLYIANLDETYQSEIIKVSRFYGIPVDLNKQFKLYDLSYVRKIMSFSLPKIIKVLTDDDYRNEQFIKIRSLDESSFDQTINQIVHIFNQYPIDKYDENDLLKMIKEDLKQTNITKKPVKNSISIIPLDEIIGLKDMERVFILNTKYESFPTIKKDNDYLSDTDKELIFYPTSSLRK